MRFPKCEVKFLKKGRHQNEWIILKRVRAFYRDGRFPKQKVDFHWRKSFYERRKVSTIREYPKRK